MRARFDLSTAMVLVILCAAAVSASPQEQPAGGMIDDVKALEAKPTPRTTDGHPDLNGAWVGLSRTRQGASNIGGRVDGNIHDLYFGDPIPGADPNTDSITTKYGDTASGGGTGEDKRKARERRNKPSYKPEFQAKVEAMGKDPNHFDPTTYSCLPAGVPRMGAPSHILQTPGKVIFLYEGYSEGGGTGRPYSTYRAIPTDGREHRKDADGTPYGDPVGHWEGDTLVIETTKFDDSTWFGPDGYFHTDAMRVTESFTRKGDTLQYTARVEDPSVLTKPFDLYPSPVTLKPGAAGAIPYNDDNPCNITDPAHDFRSHADHDNHL